VWFAENAPAWAPQPLLLSAEHLLHDYIEPYWPHFVQTFFSHSLWRQRYRFWQHPGFITYGSGLMADPRAPKELREHPIMRQLLPPRKLEGLDAEFSWCPLR
jgi:hypothetical protein